MNNNKFYSPQELAVMANATGYQSGYPGGNPTLGYDQPNDPWSMYDGSGDDVLDFGDDSTAQSFQLKGHKNRQFTMIIANTDVGPAPLIARLYGGYNQLTPALVPGLITDGAFNDVNGNAGLTGTSGNAGKTIVEFLNFIVFNPTRIPAIKILSTTDQQIAQVLTIDTLTPFRQTTKSLEIYPANEQNEYTFQNNTAVLATNFQLSNQENVLYPVSPTSTLTLTWFAGASYNTAKALQRKSHIAQENIAAAAPMRGLGA